MLYYISDQASYEAGNISDNRGVIVIGGEGHRIYQHDGKSQREHRVYVLNTDLTCKGI